VGMLYGSSIRSFIWGAGTYPIFMSPLAFLPHTIIEITGFLLAAVAGSILLRSMILKRNQDVFTKHAFILLIAAIILIFIAASVEITLPFV